MTFILLAILTLAVLWGFYKVITLLEQEIDLLRQLPTKLIVKVLKDYEQDEDLAVLDKLEEMGEEEEN